MKILNRIITFVTTVFVIIACIVFAATAICKIGNIEPRIVLSGSMEPKIHTGSICFINKKVPYDKIKTGDIIAFKAGKNTMVTHRVISVTNAGFETKGDANKVSDGISTNKTNYRGKTILSIPYANPFVIVYRTNDPATYGKAFTCFSEKTVKIEQSCIFDYKDALAKIEPNIIRSWQYTHTRTDIDFSYPARSINLKQKCKITLGTRLSFSDIGECAFRLQNCIFTNGGTILLPQEASRKKSNKLSPEGIVKDYNSQCYMKFDKIMEQLKSYETIPVTDMQQSVWNILEKLKFSSAFGFSNTRDLQKNYLSTFEKEGDALDVVIKILKIPGVLQRNYPGTTHDRVNECIGKIFNLKMEKLIV